MHTRTLQFARAHLNEGVVDRDRSHRFSARDWRRCGEFGLAGLCVEERYRGLGLGALDTAHTFEALGQGCEDGGLMFSLGAHLFACVMPIAKHANESLKQEVLPRLATGEWIGANAITEPEAGSDAFALSTLARLDGDSYVIDGVKSYVTNAPVADAFVVYAMTHPELGHLGVNAFVVERTRRGVNVGEPFAKMGLTTSPIASVYFDGCRVPVSSRLGADGAGAGVFADSMGWERTCLFAGYLGAMDRLLERCIDHAKGRKQFGKSIGKQQAVAHRIVDMKLRIESARWLLYRACWLLDRGEKAGLEVACAKLAVSEAAIRGGLDAIQIHGGAGFMVDVGIERLLRDAIGSSIFSGTSEIQRNVIAARLGL
jgi:alkylation response protein AidB-like acyl-CoA dehydrogenase